MLAPSSPIAFPSSPPPAISKRPRAPGAPNQPKPRALGGFLADDDSDDDGTPAEPSPKRRMLENDTQDAPRPHKSRAVGGFLADDDSDDDDTPAAQSPTRRTLAADSQDSLLAATKHVHLDPMDATATPPDSQLDNNPDDEAERQSYLFGSQHVDFSTSWASESRLSAPAYRLTTCSGKSLAIRERKVTESASYETIIAARSKTKEGRAKKSYYGIDIHELIDDASKQIDEARKEAAAHPITPPSNPDTPVRSVEEHQTNSKKARRGMLWTEKYRARTFMDLVGDDLTNRQVLRWLKRWDPIVFPHATKTKSTVRRPGQQHNQQPEEERPHRKILMLTGPPGLGKTTLAHVCARQAGYEVMEINASDDRSKDVVKGRIRTSLGTETVKTVSHKKPEPGKPQKVAHPVCVIVDEVDGVVSGSGGSGEGGFVRALIDLIMLDQKNSPGASGSSGTGRRKKKGDDFRQMRPLILICNDVYHPSLRPLRQSGLAEIIHVGKPSVEAVVTRLKSVFEKEGIPCEKDAARKLCEAAWGIATGIDTRKGLESNAEGDLRGVMVVGEWVAGRLKATSKDGTPCLTRQWLEKNIVHDLAHGGGGARGIGRGGTKEIATRVFQEGAGFPKQAAAKAQPKNTSHEQPQAQLGFSEQQKKYAMSRLREMIETSGEVDRIMTEVFTEYPTRDFNDDSFLTKPDSAYEWMHFHDACSSRIFSSQEWELAPYVSQPILACHQLFATSRRHQPQNNYDRKWGDAADEPDEPPLPFSGPRADYAAFEAGKLNRAALQGIQSQLPASLNRAFRSPEHIATDFLPYLVRLVSPDVKPVVVGGTDKLGSIASVRREGEKAMVRRAALVLDEVGIALLKGKIEADRAAGPATRTQWVYRMEPDLDALATFETAGALVLATQAPTRYAVRQVLDLELQKAIALRETAARQARFQSGSLGGVHEDYVFNDKENKAATQKMLTEREKMVLARGVKKDFFGRLIVEKPRPLGETDGNAREKTEREATATAGGKIWVTYHEGLNEAVRKPISLEEFMRGF